jgi:hypothetical protein
MKLTKLVYIASPYTYKGIGIRLCKRKIMQKKRYEEVTRVAGLLEEKYPYAFILPITMSHNTAKHMKVKNNGEFKYWARRDLTYINKCDELWVVTMPGWDESIGVIEEIKFAEEQIASGLSGITSRCLVKYVDPKTLRISKRPNGVK